MLDKKTIFNKRRLMTSFILTAVIYLAFIPAAFDLTEQKAFILDTSEYDEQKFYFYNNYDVLIHDGPGLNESITTLPARVGQLNGGISRKNLGKSLSFVPRWYKNSADHYYSIQKRSFLHFLYPFL